MEPFGILSIPIGGICLFFYLYKQNPKQAIGFIITFSLIILALVLFAPILARNYKNSHMHPYPRDFKVIMDSAVIYEANKDKWPISIENDLKAVHDKTRNPYYSYSCYTELDSFGNELFGVKATTKSYNDDARIPSGYFVTINIQGEKTYNYKNFVNATPAYLRDATYVGDGKEVQ